MTTIGTLPPDNDFEEPDSVAIRVSLGIRPIYFRKGPREDPVIDPRTCPSWCVYNLQDWPHEVPTVDTGAKRTYADALRIQGEEYTSVLAAVTRRVLLWERGYRVKTGSMAPTGLELNAFLAENRRLRTSAEIAVKIATRTLLPASIIGLAHWLLSDLDPDDASWFLARLADGDGLAADDPIAALRNRIVKMRVGGGRVNETEALALVVVAWNARRAGETRSKLQLPRGGLTSENFPEPR